MQQCLTLDADSRVIRRKEVTHIEGAGSGGPTVIVDH